MMKKSKTFLLSLILVTVAGFTFIVTSTGLAACPNGITAYWKLDNDYLDFIKGNDGAVVLPSTPPTLDPDPDTINGALVFNGTAGIDVAASRTFGWYATESFSVELWVKTTNVGPQVFIGRDAPGLPTAALQWYVGIGAGGLASFNLSDDDGNGQFVAGVGATRLDDGIWHHVVLVRDASISANGTTLVYVDGGDPEATYDTIAYDAGFFGSSTAPLTLGYLLVNETTPNFRFVGSLDEVAIYDRALDKDEIQAHFDFGDVTLLRPAPVADAGADFTVSAGATATLTGTGTDSNGGTISSYQWEQTVGPTVTLSSATSATTTFTAPATSTTLTFLFTVTDNDGLSDSDEITVTVGAGAPPVAGGGGGGGGGCFISSMF